MLLVSGVKFLFSVCKVGKKYSFESNTVSYEIVPGSNKIFIELSYWNYLVVCTSIGSVIFYYVCIFILDIHFISRYVLSVLNKV